MHCPQCNEENVDTAKFCKQCGVAISSRPLEHGFSTKQKLIATALLVLVFGGGIAVTKMSKVNDSEGTEQPAGEEEEIKVPREAKDFVEQYSYRFDDPVSTYYAEKDYKKNVDKYGAMLTDDYIARFKIDENISGYGDELDFRLHELPTSLPEDQETFVGAFNDFIPQLNLFMAYSARNSTQEGIRLIDNQFMKYSSSVGGEDTISEFKPDDSIVELMNVLKSIVNKYGSAANYSIAPGIIGYDDGKSTVFPKHLTVTLEKEVNSYGTRTRSLENSGVKLRINIDTYNGDKVSRSTETIEDFEVSIVRWPNTGTKEDPADFTYISICQ